MKKGENPGPGSYNARHNTQEAVVRNSPRKVSESNAIFRDRTSRDDFKHYLAHEKYKPQVAPNAYFEETRPFLKKTFNASLPPARYI